MFSLIRHFARVGQARRLTAFLAMVAVNLFFIVWTAFSDSLALHIVAVAVSGCALTALFIFQILADASIDRNLFKAPQSYAVHLFPVKSWKLLLSRTIAIVAQDVVGLILSIAGVTYLALKLGGVTERVSSYIDAETLIGGVLIFIAAYLLVVLAVAFARILSASVFYKLKGRSVLSLFATIAALYALNFVNFLAAPFGFVQNYGSMFLIYVETGLSVGMIAYILANLLQCAALFFASSYLMERKINL